MYGGRCIACGFRAWGGERRGLLTVIGTSRGIGGVAGDVEDGAFDGDVGGI